MIERIAVTVRRIILTGTAMLLLNSGWVQADEKMNFHGYGEMHYSNTDKKGGTNKVDNHRLVLGWTYSFDERISLNVEIDFEHAAQEMELEFAFIDFEVSDALNFRYGSMLMPIGYLNEFHEPPLFYSVERPYVQKYIIPTTWQEGGAGIFGSLQPYLKYRLYLVGGLDASNFKGSSGIRSGRHKVSDSPADDLAVTGRVEYSGIKGIQLGISGYQGNAGQGTAGIGDVGVNLMEVDFRYRRMGIELTGLYTRISIGDTDKINTVTGEEIGKEILGWYAEGAYHIGNLFLSGENDLVLFARHEKFDTQKEVVSAFTADPKNDRNVTTLGVTYYPIPEVALKVDVENWKNGKGESWKQFNLGLAYMY